MALDLGANEGRVFHPERFLAFAAAASRFLLFALVIAERILAKCFV
jgi:hypothetical protein